MEEARNKSNLTTGESQEQEGSNLEAQRDKNAELEPTLQKHKSGVVLLGDIVKDDSGACAVFSEQGSSASQITTAKVMDVISRLPDCDGQAADAVSACTQVKFEDVSRVLRNP